jgi:7,8-dihydro-6-hydroxymethylpterin dimethyltransferase
LLRDYIFHDFTRSFCSKCSKLCDSKIIIKNGAAFLLKRCPEHGEEIEVFEEDASYLFERHRFDKPGNKVRPDVPVERGCPYDCGLCPDHEQHTCIGVIEVTHACDLRCRVCYASSGDGAPLELERIDAMMEFYKAREGGKPEILQISGGEPTTHPEIEAILRLAKKKRFKYLMLNTNGLRLARDPKFAEFLGTLTPGFEVYLQFDGTTDSAYQKLRGTKLLAVKRAAIENLARAGVPVTLVATIARGANDSQIGDIVRFGMATDYVRGVNFQPLAFFGRQGQADVKNRVTLSGIRREIERQTDGIFRKEDIVPLPCDIDRVAVSYAVKSNDEYVPVMRKVKLEGYLELIDNTMDFRAEELVKKAVTGALTKGIACDCLTLKDEIVDMLPEGYLRWTARRRAEFIDRNTFRITITSFVDCHNFDAKSIRKECVHVITPDLRRIPFSAYNMFYREERA